MDPKDHIFKPTLAITMGDPLGIGPEIVAKTLTQDSFHGICHPLVIGDPFVLENACRELDLKLQIVETRGEKIQGESGKIHLLPASTFSSAKDPRRLPKEESARASFAYLERGAHLSLSGKVDGLVTGPVSKEAIHQAGIPFRGHTEYLAEISRTKKFVMMLAGDRLRVALVTTHIPLWAVAKSLRDQAIFDAVEITTRSLQEFFQIPTPRIGVAALNPHGGENGLFGNEETVIARAVRKAREEGISVSGPWPADTLFHRAVQGEFDAVVSMYHDQALIPLKLLHFDTAVNTTLGLPFIRTSVDHGVAYDLAGRGLASSRSLEEAIRMAAHMAFCRQGGRA